MRPRASRVSSSARPRRVAVDRGRGAAPPGNARGCVRLSSPASRATTVSVQDRTDDRQRRVPPVYPGVGNKIEATGRTRRREERGAATGNDRTIEATANGNRRDCTRKEGNSGDRARSNERGCTCGATGRLMNRWGRLTGTWGPNGNRRGSSAQSLIRQLREQADSGTDFAHWTGCETLRWCEQVPAGSTVPTIGSCFFPIPPRLP